MAVFNDGLDATIQHPLGKKLPCNGGALQVSGAREIEGQCSLRLTLTGSSPLAVVGKLGLVELTHASACFTSSTERSGAVFAPAAAAAFIFSKNDFQRGRWYEPTSPLHCLDA